MRTSVIVSAVRTPTGKFLGGLKSFTAPQLGAMVVKEAVCRPRIAPRVVHAALPGDVVLAGLGPAPARQGADTDGRPAKGGGANTNTGHQPMPRKERPLAGR